MEVLKAWTTAVARAVRKAARMALLSVASMAVDSAEMRDNAMVDLMAEEMVRKWVATKAAVMAASKAI